LATCWKIQVPPSQHYFDDIIQRRNYDVNIIYLVANVQSILEKNVTYSPVNEKKSGNKSDKKLKS
jgi:hypothetical protein